VNKRSKKKEKVLEKKVEVEELGFSYYIIFFFCFVLSHQWHPIPEEMKADKELRILRGKSQICASCFSTFHKRTKEVKLSVPGGF